MNSDKHDYHVWSLLDMVDGCIGYDCRIGCPVGMASVERRIWWFVARTVMDVLSSDGYTLHAGDGMADEADVDRCRRLCSELLPYGSTTEERVLTVLSYIHYLCSLSCVRKYVFRCLGCRYIGLEPCEYRYYLGTWDWICSSRVFRKNAAKLDGYICRTWRMMYDRRMMEVMVV